MTSPSQDFHDLVLSTLKADAAVSGYVGQRIYDRPTRGAEMPYVTFGPSDYQPDDDAACIVGRIETLQVDVFGADDGLKYYVRGIADAVKAALHERPLALTVHQLVRIEVTSVRVMTEGEGEDALITHGVVTVSAEIEEVAA